MNSLAPQTQPQHQAATRDFFPNAQTLLIDNARLEEQRIVGFVGHDERARAFNLLRTQITRALEGSGQNLIGITSPTPSAGKTFLSLNLGAALSRIAGRAVLLCDLDFRRGSVGETLGIDAPVDLPEVLQTEPLDWTRAIYRINDSDLYVMPSIGHLRGSSEMLSSPAFAAYMEGLRSLPSEVLVLCDLPPVFASDDALLTSEHLDSYLLVVEYGRNNATQVRESLRLFEPLPCLGTVLNRYKGGVFDSYGYGYGDPYGIRNYGQKSKG